MVVLWEADRFLIHEQTLWCDYWISLDVSYFTDYFTAIVFLKKTLSQRERIFSTKKNWLYAISALPEIDPTIALGLHLNRERQSMIKAWNITAQHGPLLKHRRPLLLQQIRIFPDLVVLFMFCFVFS